MITDRSVSSSSSLFFIFFPIFSPSSLSVPVAFFLLFLRHYHSFLFLRKKDKRYICYNDNQETKVSRGLHPQTAKQPGGEFNRIRLYIYIIYLFIYIYIYIDLCITRYIMISLICGKRSSLIVYGAHWRIVLFFIIFFFHRLINCKFIRNVMLHGWYNGDNGTIYIFHLFIHLFIYLYFAFCKI